MNSARGRFSPQELANPLTDHDTQQGSILVTALITGAQPDRPHLPTRPTPWLWRQDGESSCSAEEWLAMQGGRERPAGLILRIVKQRGWSLAVMGEWTGWFWRDRMRLCGTCGAMICISVPRNANTNSLCLLAILQFVKMTNQNFKFSILLPNHICICICIHLCTRMYITTALRVQEFSLDKCVHA